MDPAPPEAPRSAGGRVWRRLVGSAGDLWRRARNEHSAPHEVGLSVGIGVFCACTPFLGFHLLMAAALATVFRLNRLWAILGSRTGITPIWLSVAFCEIEVAHRLRVGEWVTMSVGDVAARGKELAIDWALGTASVGGAIAVLGGLAAYAVARTWPRGAARGTLAT